MAKINGVELKAVKEHMDSYTGHQSMHANIYIDGKKIGSCDNDGWGGDTMFSFIGDGETLFEARMMEHYAGKMMMDCLDQTQEDMRANGCRRVNIIQWWGASLNEAFIEDLLHLKECEKFYKKGVKKGYPELIDIKYVAHNGPAPLDFIMWSSGTDESYEECLADARGKCEFFESKRYQSLNDFCIK